MGGVQSGGGEGLGPREDRQGWKRKKIRGVYLFGGTRGNSNGELGGGREEAYHLERTIWPSEGKTTFKPAGSTRKQSKSAQNKKNGKKNLGTKGGVGYAAV